MPRDLSSLLRRVHAGAIVVVLAVMAIMAVQLSAAAGERRGTAEEAQAMVARAIALFDEIGPARTFAKINEHPAPEFHDRDLYVFVFGPDGDALAHAADPSNVGRNAADLRDVDGKLLGQAMMQAASKDGAWVDYRWENPLTGKVEPKSSWVVRHRDHVFGAGIYKP